MKKLLKKPSAWIPLAMSVAALALTLSYLAFFGISTTPQTDEGTAAHLFQLLMAGQFPIIAFFAIKWLPKMPKEAFQVLFLQFVAGLLACAPVFLLGL